MRLAALLALVLVLVLSGVAPSVSRVVAAGLVPDLCTSDGTPHPGQRDAGHGTACALCLPHGGSDAAPPLAPSGALRACSPEHRSPVAVDGPASQAPPLVRVRGPPRA